MDITKDEHLDRTILTTPQPKAASTETKKVVPEIPRKLKQIKFRISDSDKDSLGTFRISDVLRHERPESYADNTYVAPIPLRKQRPETPEMKPVKLSITKAIIDEKIRVGQEKARQVMLKYSNMKELPSMYLKPSETVVNSPMSARFTDSTISESDLLKEKTEDSLHLHYTDDPLYQNKNLTDDYRRMSQNISVATDTIRNSSLSFKEIFEKYKLSNSTFNDITFEPAPDGIEVLKADEKSWRLKNEIPARQSSFSQSISPQTSKMSMGEFFKGKSDDYDEMFQAPSPEKREPVALIDDSQTASPPDSEDILETTCHNNETRVNILSLSKIQHMIQDESETPNKLVDRLIAVNPKVSQESAAKQLSYKENYYNSRASYDSPSMKKANCKKYHSSNDLRCGDDMKKMVSAKSTSSISEDNKENMDRSLESVRSVASSIDTLPEGKSPITCNKEELIWGCVKIGKVSTQDFVVRNRHQNKMRFQVTSTSPNFKISKLDTDPLPTVAILLHPMESRQFTISFTPMNKGAQLGKIIFYPIIKGEIQKKQSQMLRMCGYGGHASIDIQNLPKDSTGKLWLPLGNLDTTARLSQKFIVRNSGTISGFAYFTANSKSICSYAKIVIIPSEVVLKPGERKSITVEYLPTKEDYKSLLKTFSCGSEVFEISQVGMIFGSEFLRGRIRGIHNQLLKKKLMSDKIVDKLSDVFPGESMPEDIKFFHDTIEDTQKILRLLNYKEISITIEQDPDKTLVPGMDGIDETSMFHTLVNNYSNLNVTDIQDNGILTAEPTYLILTPPFKINDSIILSSDSKKDVQYEIQMQPEGLLVVNNRMGTIRAGQMNVVKLTCGKRQVKDRQSVKVKVFTENDIVEIDVKIIYNLNG